ncbi:1062_t:CDS:2, partial [Racocetra persica]
ISHSTLNIANLVNLTLPEFSEVGNAIFSSEPVLFNQSRDIDNMNYNPIQLAHQMIARNKDINDCVKNSKLLYKKTLSLEE